MLSCPFGPGLVSPLVLGLMSQSIGFQGKVVIFISDKPLDIRAPKGLENIAQASPWSSFTTIISGRSSGFALAWI